MQIYEQFFLTRPDQTLEDKSFKQQNPAETPSSSRAFKFGKEDGKSNIDINGGEGDEGEDLEEEIKHDQMKSLA